MTEALPFFIKLLAEHHAAMLAVDVERVQWCREEARNLACASTAAIPASSPRTLAPAMCCAVTPPPCRFRDPIGPGRQLHPRHYRDTCPRKNGRPLASVRASPTTRASPSTPWTQAAPSSAPPATAVPRHPCRPPAAQASRHAARGGIRWASARAAPPAGSPS